MVTVRVFVADVEQPGEVAQTLVQRAQAAARRFEGQARVELCGLDSPEATDCGAGVEPTVAVGDMVLAVGRALPAGHLVRAITLALEDA